MSRSQEISREHENIVRNYFTNRGWSYKKLDKKGSKNNAASDWLFASDEVSLLCEVKTIFSVRANLLVEENFLQARNKQRDEISRWHKENPDKHIVMPQEQYEFLYGDEAEFLRKFQGRRRNTEEPFKRFAKEMKEYFSRSSVSQFSCVLRIDSDDLYAPARKERHDFFAWIEKEIFEIYKGTPAREWVIDNLGYGWSFWTSYLIHKAVSDNDVDSRISVNIFKYDDGSKFEVDVHGYGGLNFDAIQQNIEKARKQLRSVSQYPNVARIIVLAFDSGLGSEWGELQDYIVWFLKGYTDLSAIAVMYLDFANPAANFLDFATMLPIVDKFIVYHNPWLQGVKPLDVRAFDSEYATQLCLVKTRVTQ